LPLYGLRYLRFGAAVVPGIFRIASFPITLIRQRYGLRCLQKSGKVSDFIIYESIIVALKEWLDYNIQDRQFIIFYRGMNVSLSINT